MHQSLQRARDNRSGYFSKATIAAITTAPGGSIAMIRVSGPEAFSTLHSLTELSPDRSLEYRKMIRAEFKDGSSMLDDGLFVIFKGPDSFTGEDVVEFHLHGGGYIAQRFMGVLANKGVRQALPGEFSFRAVRNGKMSISQAQAVSDLISASNDGAVALAMEKMSGTQNQILADLANTLRRIASLGELGIDFADQDVDEVSLTNLKKQIQIPIEALSNLKKSFSRGLRVQDGIRLAIIGLPNAGKSSLFNALLGEDRSIVSEIAGTTRDLVGERITLRDGHKNATLRLEDTAGLRKTDNKIESIGVDRSLKAAREADLLLWVVDPAQKADAVREQWKALEHPKEKTIGIFTKCDLMDETSLDTTKKRYAEIGITEWYFTSSKTGFGISDVVRAILVASETWVQRKPGEILLTRLDQFHSVSEALDHLVRAEKAPEIDLFASDLRQALHALSPLIGETLTEDILGKIFSEFCIGK